MQDKRFISEAYESFSAKKIFGQTFHPGNLEFTARVAEIAGIEKSSFVMDVACGEGVASRFFAGQYACKVVGIDFSYKMLCRAQDISKRESLSSLVYSVRGDANKLPFLDSVFDVLISECSFSLLSDKEIAAQEFRRVLKPEGKLVITDVILNGQIDEDLRTRATYALCVAGAETLKNYISLFEQAGFIVYCVEDHSKELKKLAFQLLTNPNTQSTLHDSASKQNWQRLFKQGKPGYALIAMVKS